LIEVKASGTQLTQELISEGIHAVQNYHLAMNKVMWLHSVTTMVENGFAYLSEKVPIVG
jgi:hypothetical protein